MKACYKNYFGPLLLMVTGALIMGLLLSRAHSAPPPVEYARAGLPDAGTAEFREQVDAAPPTNDGLGTSPSWADIGMAAGALYALLNVFVALTPTQRDDEALSRARALLERMVFLSPRNVPGVFSLPGKRARPNPEGV